jgi:hypothetical protein
MEESLKTMLLKLAKQKISLDNNDFSVLDYSGENIDDAYAIGLRHGEVLLAREILDLYCIKY